MIRRLGLCLFVLHLIFCVESANGQGTHTFLGGPREVADKYSPRHGIRYNTQGYDKPRVPSAKRLGKWQKKGVPDWAIQEILSFPGSADAIGLWIDEAFDRALAQFTACNGALAERARTVAPKDVTVRIMPSAFYEPFYKVNVAAAYYPGTREIKVLNIYYTWSGANKGWLRHARDLLVWEMGNYLAYACAIQPEPRIAGWPCTAPPVSRSGSK